MSRAEGFVNWIREGWEQGNYYRPASVDKFPQAAYFDLTYEVTGSLMKGKQWYFFKMLPPGLSSDTAHKLYEQKAEAIKSKSGFFKMLQSFLTFFYISDEPVSREILAYLGDFVRARKKFLGNVSEITVYLDTSTGDYLMPHKTGFVGALPIKKVYKEVQKSILEPYVSWVKDQ